MIRCGLQTVWKTAINICPQLWTLCASKPHSGCASLSASGGDRRPGRSQMQRKTEKEVSRTHCSSQRKNKLSRFHRHGIFQRNVSQCVVTKCIRSTFTNHYPQTLSYYCFDNIDRQDQTSRPSASQTRQDHVVYINEKHLSNASTQPGKSLVWSYTTLI